MRPIFFLSSIAILVMLAGFRMMKGSNRTARSFNLQEYKAKNLVRCSPDWDAIKDWIEEVDIPPMPGAGTLTWTIDTRNDSAQFYFNQGINMYYGFHIIEAMASFKKGARFDPRSAMLQWAQALAYGPNINDVGYSATPAALLVGNNALALSANSTPLQKDLISAQLSRYSSDSTRSRTSLNQAYADQMKALYEKYPGEADVAALYADALMLQHPWDLWKVDGTPRPWTPTIRAVLEKLLALAPQHPGANHYYIHVMEPSPFSSKALASADRLGTLSPGLSHMVHMPSHIYLRNGEYAKGTIVNEKAVASYQQYRELYAPVAGNDFLYVIHNLHMQTNNAMMNGRSQYAIQSAISTDSSIMRDYLKIPGALGNLVQYVTMTPTLTYVRFGRWKALLELPAPDSSLIYSRVLYHFGRGMALAGQSKLPAARQELQLLTSLLKDSSLSIPFYPFSPAIDGARVAESILEGTIALKDNNRKKSIAAFNKAVEMETEMVYNEPRDWLLSPRHYLGNAYLLNKEYAKARNTFNADLSINAGNVWSLYGLYQADALEGKKAAASEKLRIFNNAFIGGDVEIKAAVY